MEYNMFRPLSEEEKVDNIPVKHTSILDAFLKEVAKKQTKYQRMLRPYDSYGARMDFESYLKSKANDMMNSLDKDSDDNKIDFGDLNKYADISRFEFVDEREIMSIRVVEGLKKEIVSGSRYKFKCKKRKNTLTIVVSGEQKEEFEKWLNKEFLNKEENTKEDTKEITTDTKLVVSDDKHDSTLDNIS